MSHLPPSLTTGPAPFLSIPSSTLDRLQLISLLPCRIPLIIRLLRKSRTILISLTAQETTFHKYALSLVHTKSPSVKTNCYPRINSSFPRTVTPHSHRPPTVPRSRTSQDLMSQRATAGPGDHQSIITDGTAAIAEPSIDATGMNM